MYKILLKITGIILGNLLAFFIIGLILDALFQTNGLLILASVLFSLPVFGLIMYLSSGKFLQELHTLSHTDDGKS